MKEIFKRLLILLGLSKTPLQKVVDVPIVEHKTFTETGEFIKADEFEEIWIEKWVRKNYNKATNHLNDDEWVDYKLWEDMNDEVMYKKHLPNTLVVCGKNPNIIFSAGCLGCKSQRLNGLERCKGCRYFRSKNFSWDLPDLRIDGEEADTMSADDIQKLLGR